MGNFTREGVREYVREGNEAVRRWVFERFKELPFPEVERKKEVEGEALVASHPILGIEKYLGMWDSERRLPYFPSIKLSHDSYTTYLYAKFDPSLSEDVIEFDGKPAEGKDLKRFLKIVRKFRELTGVETKVYISSKHVPKVGTVRGKGLGLSASASGAAAAGLLLAAGYKELYENDRFLSYLARHLSGSGTSAIGGFTVWFGYEGAEDKESYAVKVDDGSWVELVVVPIPLVGFKTASAHKAAVASPFYWEWAYLKPRWVLEVLEAIERKDLKDVGEHAERDAYWLSMLISTGGSALNTNALSTAVARKVLDLRREGVPVYYTFDTGPSVAILTEKGRGKEVVEKLKDPQVEKLFEASGAVFEPFVAEAAGRPREITGSEKERILRDVLRVM